MNSLTEIGRGERGKSCMNALKHGILSHNVFDDEKTLYEGILTELSSEYGDHGVLTAILIERVAVHILQLRRISHARNEYLRLVEQPGKVVDKLGLDLDFIEVVEEPYKPDIEPDTLDKLLSLYHRYEVSAENRLYRAMKELRLLDSP